MKLRPLAIVQQVPAERERTRKWMENFGITRPPNDEEAHYAFLGEIPNRLGHGLFVRLGLTSAGPAPFMDVLSNYQEIQ